MIRRTFLGGLVGGLGLALASDAFGDEPSGGTTAKPNPVDPKPVLGLQPNAFVHVAVDGLVSIVCHRSEMGQGIRSTLPVLVADELGADMARVKIVQAEGDKKYGDQNTDGSTSIRTTFVEMRTVAATARTMLIAVAAKRWKVDPQTCAAHKGEVVHLPSKRALAFGALAEEAGKLPVPKPEKVILRPRSELRLFAELPLVDGPDIVTGKAMFGADLRLPGMLTAVIARPPVVGGRVVKFDPARALAIPGVKKVIELPAAKAPFGFQAVGGVAVLADNTWAAMRGRAALDITWDDGANASYDSPAYRESLLAAVRAPARSVRNVGDVDKALAEAKKRVDAEYYVPHLAHVSMEPPAVVARVDGGACEVWASTQNPQAARKEAARALGIDENKVRVNVTLLGGGFGRKSKADYVSEAVLLAREAKTPVRVQWTREDDVRHDYYHTVSAQRLSAALDESNKVTAWLHRSAYPPIGSTFGDAVRADVGEMQQGMLDVPLAIPNVRAENAEARAHVRIGWLRSVCNIFHAFAINSFIDELAHARSIDPLDNLLEVFGPARIAGLAELGVEKLPNYKAPLDQHPIDVGRLRHVIERVAELSGFRERKKNGRALGIAAHRSFLSYTAAVVSVVRDPNDRLRVDEAWLVGDFGTIVNAERVCAQMEGAVIFGMSIAMYGAITMRKGVVEQTNFRDHKLVRIAEAPRKLHTEIVKSEKLPGGVGEPGVPPIAPAFANAVFALTGQRHRNLPIVAR